MKGKGKVNELLRNYDKFLLAVVVILLSMIEVSITSGALDPFLSQKNVISEDPNITSSVQVTSSTERYIEKGAGAWNISGDFSYNAQLEGLVVHPWPNPLSEDENLSDTRRSGVEQVVQLPQEGELKAVLEGKNIAYQLKPEGECADSRMILEVVSLESGDRLKDSKIVGKETSNITLSLSQFAGEKVKVGGYGHYGDGGCGSWSGEFTFLESLYIERETSIFEKFLGLNLGDQRSYGTNSERENKDRYKNISANYKTPPNESVPEIEHTANWWRRIDEPPYRALKRDYCQLFGGWSRTVIEPPVETCINEHGYRGKAYGKEKPEDAFRIMSVGDAVTFGQGVKDNETYPAYLEKRLDKSSYSNETDFQVINYGFPAWNTRKEIQMFERHGVKYDPDLVILQYMENDAQNLSKINELASKYYKNLSKRIDDDRARIISQRTAFDTERRQRMNKTIDEEMEVVSPYLERLDNLSEEKEFDVLLMYYSTEFSDRHKDYIRSEAERLGWGFFNTDLARLENYTRQDYLIYPEDDFYLNSLGYNLTAKQLMAHLHEEDILEDALDEK